jgi:uncharacterized protein YkwD
LKGFFLFLLTTTAVIFFFFSNQVTTFLEALLEGQTMITLENDTSKSNLEITELKTAGVHEFIGLKSVDILDELGEPDRIDPTAYNYNWWIYNNETTYFQIGMKQGTVVSAFGFGEKLNAAPFTIGDSRATIENKVKLENEISISYKGSSYLFTLSAEDLNMRPIVAIENGWAQLYFDTFTDTLSSVRYIDTETLLLHRPYTIKYRGTLTEAPSLTREQWEEIERANEQQVLAITNIIREKFKVKQLKWHEQVATVAFKHSKDMSVNNYFAHESPTKGNLGDRLKADNIAFSFAGENIASNYVDALASVEGWLNSEGHRKALLSDKYTHLGVGVFKKFYTQNFIKE